MDEKTVVEALGKLRKETQKRKFVQTIDLIISLKSFDVKKGDKIDDYVALPHGDFKKQRYCALVGKELAENAKKNCDTTIKLEEFNDWAKTPREIKKMARTHDHFFAQANLMPDVARVFGKYLGAKGKMPNPKLGQVVPPNGDLAPVIKRLNNTAILRTKNQPNIHTTVGNEQMEDGQIAENALVIIDRVLHELPNAKQQVKHIHIKMTMSKSVKLE
jgi:large subunit ribosomal protein L1